MAFRIRYPTFQRRGYWWFGWGTTLQARKSRVSFTVGALGYSFDLILPATL